MIDGDWEVTVKRQVQPLDVSRASVYYRPRPVSERDLRLMLPPEAPCYGARKLAAVLRREGHAIGRRHVCALMRRMWVEAMYRRRRTSIPGRGAAIYPYFLENVAIEGPNQVSA